MNNPSPILNVQQLGKSFSEADNTLVILADLNLQVMPAQTMAIVGASGSGKTTLLQCLGGLDQPSTGSVAVAGRDWQAMSVAEQGYWRNQHVGFVYQFHHLLPEFSALENVAMPLLIRGELPKRAYEQARAVLSEVGLGPRLNHRPKSLSGGERQRAAVARALVTSPSLVLADEPTGNLDRANAERVLECLLALNRQFNSSLVIVTHDEQLAKRLDQCWRLDGGKMSTVL